MVRGREGEERALFDWIVGDCINFVGDVMRVCKKDLDV